MTFNRRHALLAALALPAGCTVQPLASFPTTPIPAPSRAAALRAPKGGQSWTYRKLNFFNGSLLDTVQETVAAVASTIEVNRRSSSGAVLADEKHAAWGQLLRDPVWDYPLNFEAPMPLWPASLSVGEKASARSHYRMDGGTARFWFQVSCVVKGWERVGVAAGNFDTLRVERMIRLQHEDHTRAETLRYDTLWVAPEVGRWVARENWGEFLLLGASRMGAGDFREERLRWELTAWQ